MMKFVTTAAENAEMAKTGGGVLMIAALGLLVVFAVLVLLMGVIKLMGALMKEKAKPAQAESSTTPAAQAAPARGQRGAKAQGRAAQPLGGGTRPGMVARSSGRVPSMRGTARSSAAA